MFDFVKNAAANTAIVFTYVTTGVVAKAAIFGSERSAEIAQAHNDVFYGTDVSIAAAVMLVVALSFNFWLTNAVRKEYGFWKTLLGTSVVFGGGAVIISGIIGLFV